MFGVLPELLEGDKTLPARTEAAEREVEKLRKDTEMLRKETENLRKDIDGLRKENEKLRAEKDEVAQAFSKVMDSVQPMNQIAQKLGMKKSPFEREPKQPGAPVAKPGAGEGGA